MDSDNCRDYCYLSYIRDYTIIMDQERYDYNADKWMITIFWIVVVVVILAT